jgi:hypothetical protein
VNLLSRGVNPDRIYPAGKPAPGINRLRETGKPGNPVGIRVPGAGAGYLFQKIPVITGYPAPGRLIN